MAEPARDRFAWMDLLWLAFLGGLAVLQPVFEIHKQLTLVAIGLFQIFEGRFLVWGGPRRGPAYAVIIKIGLATLLIAHTGEIFSSYYLIYYLPVVTAAMYFGPSATLLWTALASIFYCSFLITALQEFELTASGVTELAIRNLFFFLAAVVVNRFVMANRRQAERYRKLAEELAETNRQLVRAEAEARRSERLAALGQLSAGLAHEIRNPLGVIKGSAETLSKKLNPQDALAAELAGYISSEVNRLNMLVSRFLDFARPHELEKHPTNLAELIDQALKSARDRWPGANLEVVRQYASGLPPVPADAELCEQVFANLINNAYEAMGSGGGKLRVSTHGVQVKGRAGVEVVVEDSGPGIPAEICEQVFNPFFTTKKGGFGLGLSIVSKIVDDHGGWIRIQPEPGHGACFRVFFPGD